jgi:soluble lytic murein transglycosylase-like protein
MIIKTRKAALLFLAFIIFNFAAQTAICTAKLLAASAASTLNPAQTADQDSIPATPAKSDTPRAILSLPIFQPVDPYVNAARKTGVPLDLLIAVAGAESGWHPWALNIRGQEYYCRSQAEAAIRLISAPDADIGLMQVNFSFWGPRLGYSKTELLDPAINLLAGARILKLAMDRKGDFWGRAASYHSLNSQEQLRWSKAVYAHYREYLSGFHCIYINDRVISLTNMKFGIARRCHN